MTAAEQDPQAATPVHRADPAYRRRIMLALLLAVVAGTLVLWLLAGWLGQGPGEHGIFRRHALLVALFGSIAFAMALPLAAFGVWLLRLARRIDGEGRFPPDSLHTTHDYPVITGAPARRQARLHRLLALCAFALATAVLAWGAWVYLAFAP